MINPQADVWKRVGTASVLIAEDADRPVHMSWQSHGGPVQYIPLTISQAESLMLCLVDRIKEAGGDPLKPVREWAAWQKTLAEGGATVGPDFIRNHAGAC